MASTTTTTRLARSVMYPSLHCHCTIIRTFARNVQTTSFDVKVKSVPVDDAYKLLQAGNPYLDVRTHDEFNHGHASGAVNIPYQFRNASEMIKNPKFLEQVSSQFLKDDHIVVGCKSGRRSLMAATDLQAAGFTRVTDVSGGYSAWIEHGLPVSKQGH